MKPRCSSMLQVSVGERGCLRVNSSPVRSFDIPLLDMPCAECNVPLVRGSICGACRRVACAAKGCTAARVAPSARCGEHTKRCTACNGPILKGSKCGACRATECVRRGCVADSVGDLRWCAEHMPTCTRCARVLPRVAELCAECRRNTCGESGCAEVRGESSSYCALHAPCAVFGECAGARVTNRHACVEHVRMCTTCRGPKPAAGLRCEVCERLKRYGREDGEYTARVRAELEAGRLACECCTAPLATWEEVRVDHDHLADGPNVRGLICNTCNTTLVEGLQRPESLAAFIVYLRRTNPETIALMHELTAPEA